MPDHVEEFRANDLLYRSSRLRVAQKGRCPLGDLTMGASCVDVGASLIAVDRKIHVTSRAR